MKTIPVNANSNFKKWKYYHKLERNIEWVRQIENDLSLEKFFTDNDEHLHVWYKGYRIVTISYNENKNLLTVETTRSLLNKPDPCPYVGEKFKLPGTNTTVEEIKKNIDKL